MASNDELVILQCCNCKNELDMEGKTLTCLHSFCETCVEKEIKGETSRNGQCLQCDEIVQIDQLTLSTILVSCLKGRRMESIDWKCDLCLKDGKESIATNWCKNCEKFFCVKCYQYHQKFLHEHNAFELRKLPQKQHNSIEITESIQEEIKESMRADMCKIHNEIEDSYCKTCNLCFCDACYNRHLEYSPHCSFCSISVREEALKKLEHEGPTLLREIKDWEKNLLERNKKSGIYCKKLERQCDVKCEELWQDYDNIIEELRNKTQKMCDELRRITNEQVEKGRKFQNETDKILKKLEIWGLNLRHLLKKDKKERDIVLGVELVARKLASSSPELYEKINESLRELQLQVEFSDFWKKFFQELQNRMIGSGSLDYSDNFIQFENEWNLPRFNRNRCIESIVVDHGDNHIFLADSRSDSIIEMKESGELVTELVLTEGTNTFIPKEMFFLSSEILGVNCRRKLDGREMLFFLERENFFPYLKFKKIINKENENFSSFSACKIKESILICNDRRLRIDFYTEEGEYIKTIDNGVLENGSYLIRADPSTENFWAATRDSYKIYFLNEDGRKRHLYEIKERFSDFSINEFGEIYFCNSGGIFALFPKNNLYKYLHKFEKEFKSYQKIFVSREKIFVCLLIDENYLIRIFKFTD